MTFIQQSACRIFRALFEIALKRQWASLAYKLLNICKMCEHRLWSSQSPLRQFTTIPDVIIRKFEKNSDLIWNRYHDLKPVDLGEIVKIPKMGKNLYKYIHMFPKLVLSANIQPITRSLISIDLTLTPDFEYDITIHGNALLFWVMVIDLDGEKILYYTPFILKSNYSTIEHQLNMTITLTDPLPPQYYIKVISDRWLHSESTLSISFRHIILPSKFPPPTELLDLQPLPVKILGENIASIFYKDFTFFNPIQTQTYSSIYETNNSILICAPTGSGKTVCAEYAILRLFNNNIDSKCVYIAPTTAIAHSMYIHWLKRFTTTGIYNNQLTVVELTGDNSVDLRLIEAGNIIITTSTQYDSISRRWKQRKTIQNISLYIVDELHMIGGKDGPTLEIVLSRIRYISSQLERHIRIIALSSSLANAKDVGEWLGISTQYIYNFTPQNRSIPIDTHIFGFETSHPATRILSMAKPVFNAVSTHTGPNKPGIIYTPSRKQAQLTAIDIITYTAAIGQPNRFLNYDINKLNDVITTLHDTTLVETVQRGVAFYHNGLHKSDIELINMLYSKGIITILVCTYDICYSIPSPASLVVVMDTVYYEGKEHRYIDISISDLLQMIGTASNPHNSDPCKAVIFCQSPKKEGLAKLLHTPLPIESHLDQYLHDHICAEITSRTIENKQDAVDYLTWTYYYRRLNQNPNYYNLHGITHGHISDHLSELIENVINELADSKCISIEDDYELLPLNIGIIASYYYIQYTTIELYASSLTEKTKIKGLIEVLSSSTEYSNIPIRVTEERILASLSKHITYTLPEGATYDDPAIKVLILIQTYFSRQTTLYMSSDLLSDIRLVLESAIKLLQAIVDVLSSQGWLKPALAAMELSQMIVQGMWNKDSVLLQLPHITNEIITKCHNSDPPIETIFDILELNDEKREEIFKNLSISQISDIAVFCNSYPNIELTYKLNLPTTTTTAPTTTHTTTATSNSDSTPTVVAGELLSMNILLKREWDEEDEENEEENIANIG